MLGLAAIARELAGSENLCLAGGVALNCKANGLLAGPVFAPPAPHDAGTALGAAWHVAPPRGAAGGRISAFLGPAPGTASLNGAFDGLHREPLSLERVCAGLRGGPDRGDRRRGGRDRPARARPPLDRRRPEPCRACTAG